MLSLQSLAVAYIVCLYTFFCIGYGKGLVIRIWRSIVVTPYDILTLSAIVVMLLAVISIVYRSWRNGISPMPSSAQVRRVVADEVNRHPKQGLLLEAGSGWGTLALHVAKHCAGWRIIGIENSPLPLWISRLTAKLGFWLVPMPTAGSRQASITFIRGDLYTYPYDNVDYVICYLYPGAMHRLSPIYRERLSSEAYVISVCFALPGWQPERVVTCGDLYRTQVYVYNVGVNKV
jgi:hypothetical protein